MEADKGSAPELARLARRYGLGQRQCGQISTLLSMLESDTHAPTAVRDRARAVSVHVADSLSGLELDAVRSAGMIADLGAGAGFPGLVLAAALPASRVRLVESQSRKCVFMRDAVERTGVANAQVVCMRAEEWRDGLREHDLVVARALAVQPVVLEYGAPLLRLGGSLVDWRGRRSPAEEATALRAAGELGLELVQIRRVKPFQEARDHHLHLFVKVAETPERFPRRAGLARKRPLGRRASGAGPI
jgi:16S rRNA (guanine527-N7)-methyltransferase